MTVVALRDRPGVFVHEKGFCESDTVGDGTRIWAFAHVMKGARIGKKCNLGEGVFVENKVNIGNGCTIKNGVAIYNLVEIEDDVFIGPNAVFTNDFRPRAFLRRGDETFFPTRIKRGATIGANATIVCGVTIGEYAMVGAGAVVTKNVPPHTLVVGSPAKKIGLICFCGDRLNPKKLCKACGKKLADNSPEKAAMIVSQKQGKHV